MVVVVAVGQPLSYCVGNDGGGSGSRLLMCLIVVVMDGVVSFFTTAGEDLCTNIKYLGSCGK